MYKNNSNMGKFPFKYDTNSKKAIATETIVPMRKESSESSEMVSQLLWGEPIEILEVKESWMLIQSMADGYRGWISSNMVEKLSDSEFASIAKANLIITATTSEYLIGDTKMEYHIPSGAFIFEKEPNGGYFHPTVGAITLKNPIVENKPVDIISTAISFLNSPYLWGGKTVFGLDCSGFVQTLFRIHGKFIPRDASQQASTGKNVDFITEVLPGDLAFFDNEEGIITHVGVIAPESKVIHASGRVRLDSIDHQGIFNAEIKTYTHKLRIIKRIT